MRIMGTALALLVLSGCASPVLVDYQADAGFDRYTTYAFVGDGGSGAKSLDGQRIEEAAAPRLSERGLEPVPEDQADLLVHYSIREIRRVESTGVSFGLGVGHDNIGLGLGTRPEVYEVREGRLVLEFEDRAGDQVVWRAESRHDLNPDLTGEKRRQRIHKLVGQMLERFPPARKAQ
jgi:hypothetical protein